jgi:hypothetical protein
MAEAPRYHSSREAQDIRGDDASKVKGKHHDMHLDDWPSNIGSESYLSHGYCGTDMISYIGCRYCTRYPIMRGRFLPWQEMASRESQGGLAMHSSTLQ